MIYITASIESDISTDSTDSTNGIERTHVSAVSIVSVGTGVSWSQGRERG